MQILDDLNRAIKAGQPVALCTIVQTQGAVPRHAGAKMIVYGTETTEGIPALLKTDAKYIGLICSSRCWNQTQEKLRSTGLTEEETEHMKSPIGLNINAETPNEIAVSIMTEIIANKNHIPEQ
jgi:xanthine dehydrogenase accessory factor